MNIKISVILIANFITLIIILINIRMTTEIINNITLIALFLNIITLIIVFFQTYYTKKSLDTANDSLKLTQTSQQLNQLPQMHYVIHVQMFLEKWLSELKEDIEILEKNNTKEIFKLTNKKPVNRKGLLDEWMYNKMPDWLSVIYSTGVQYYFTSSCNYPYLWDKKNDKPNDNELFIQRLQESINALEKLLQYIKDKIPNVFLECPASLDTSHFFEDPKYL